MNNALTANDLQIKLGTQPTGTLKYDFIEATRLRPLPNGRPIAANTSIGVAEVMGYLD